MADSNTKMPVKTEAKNVTPAPVAHEWQPLETLRREIDRLFDNFHHASWHLPISRTQFGTEPFWRRGLGGNDLPAVDIVEKEKAYEITAELPGLDEKNIELKISNGVLTIKGEKQEEKETQKKDYYLHERSYGSFQRSFSVPDGVDVEKADARFKKGVLSVTMPKTPEAQKKEKKIPISAG